MTDDTTALAAELREHGHEELAKALELKDLANHLRAAGREDLAGQLEESKDPPEPSEQRASDPWALAEAARRHEGELILDGLRRAGIVDG